MKWIMTLIKMVKEILHSPIITLLLLVLVIVLQLQKISIEDDHKKYVMNSFDTTQNEYRKGIIHGDSLEALRIERVLLLNYKVDRIDSLASAIIRKQDSLYELVKSSNR